MLSPEFYATGHALGNCVQVAAVLQVWGSVPNQQVNTDSLDAARLLNPVLPGGRDRCDHEASGIAQGTFRKKGRNAPLLEIHLMLIKFYM